MEKESPWMTYEEYLVEKIWMNLAFRGASSKVIQEILDECKENEYPDEVLEKYHIHI